MKLISSKITVSSIPITVLVREPDVDLTDYENKYPVATLTKLYVRDNVYRQGDGTPIVVENTDTTITTEEQAKPFELFYQIDFWTKNQKDMDEITMKWLINFDRDFVLTVKDLSGAERKCLALRKDQLKQNDFVGERPTYHTFTTYKISVSLDENVRKTYTKIQEVKLQ
jgi:hypothetical protein